MGLEQACQLAVGIGTGFTAFAALIWLGLALPMIWERRSVRGLASAPPRDDSELPSVTIVSAARDEAARVEHAAESFRALRYPGLEIVLVDDRSTDATGGILDRLAAADSRVHAIHVTSLPAGWLGKCHALARGAAEAKGEWLLFTDGDVWMHPDALRQAISLAADLGADHLAVGSDLEVHSLGERIFVAYFSALFYASQKPWEAPDPKSKSHVGIGAFNLVRRDVYDHAGGHERLRMEIVDDMALGLIVKQAGAKSWFALHDGFVRVRWHEGVRGLIRGVEKNAFAALRYRAGETVVSVGVQFFGTLAPALGWLLPGVWPKVFALAGWIGIWMLYRAIGRNLKLEWWDFLTAPIGGALFAYAILRSMIITLRQRGVNWRDTHYAIEELRKGRVR
ncbi:MAG TPA: glycosyltransferase [Candidatus Eisenbacteria bacterium]|nr:glycosyltransferase [Candidatus Eisenbacteria bacterium]